MTAKHLKGIWIERRSTTTTLCGDLAAIDFAIGSSAAGYGLAGQIVASAVCARGGADGAFVRRLAKGHGTGGRFDGALTRGAIEQVFCSREDLPECRDALIELDMTHAQLVSFDARPSQGRFAGLVGERPIPASPPLSLRDAVVCLQGRFKLSSGASASRYWETLPAANRFRIARNLGLAGGSNSEIVGVGHGGAYLATVAALVAGRQPIVVDPSIPGHETLDGHAIVLDDYVTTGTSFLRVLASVPAACRAACNCVSLYGAQHTATALDWVRVLHPLP